MSRADFWCRVLGWLQLGASVVCGAIVYWLWRTIFFSNFAGLDGFFTFIQAFDAVVLLVILFFVLPGFLSGLFTVLFANAVEQSQDGVRGLQKIFLRIVMALAGLWSAGVIGTAGLTLPPLGFFGILALASVVLAIMGPDWTADLFNHEEATR